MFVIPASKDLVSLHRRVLSKLGPELGHLFLAPWHEMFMEGAGIAVVQLGENFVWQHERLQGFLLLEI